MAGGGVPSRSGEGTGNFSSVGRFWQSSPAEGGLSQARREANATKRAIGRVWRSSDLVSHGRSVGEEGCGYQEDAPSAVAVSACLNKARHQKRDPDQKAAPRAPRPSLRAHRSCRPSEKAFIVAIGRWVLLDAPDDTGGRGRERKGHFQHIVHAKYSGCCRWLVFRAASQASRLPAPDRAGGRPMHRPATRAISPSGGRCQRLRP